MNECVWMCMNVYLGENDMDTADSALPDMPTLDMSTGPTLEENHMPTGPTLEENHMPTGPTLEENHMPTLDHAMTEDTPMTDDLGVSYFALLRLFLSKTFKALLVKPLKI